MNVMLAKPKTLNFISDVSGQNISISPHQYTGHVTVHYHGNLFQFEFFVILLKKLNHNKLKKYFFGALYYGTFIAYIHSVFGGI
jgi:hypothetical protein